MYNQEQKFSNKRNDEANKSQLEKRKLLQSKFSGIKSDYQLKTDVQKDIMYPVASPKNTDLLSKDTIIKLKKEIKEEKESNKKLKKTIFDQNNSIKEHIISYNSLLSENTNIKDEINSIKTELETMKSSSTTKNLSKLSVENSSLKKEVQELKLRCNYFIKENGIIKKEQHINVYQTQISQLNDKIEEYRSYMSSRDKRISIIKKELLDNQTEFEKEIDYLKNVIIDISSEIDLPPTDELLTFLEINLTYENHRQYDKVHNILWKINRLKNENNIPRKKRIKPEYISPKSIFGYLVLKDDIFYFSSIHGEAYLIDSCRIKLRKHFVEDMPASASIRDNYARIEFLHEDEDMVTTKFNKERVVHNKKKLDEIEKEMDKIAFERPFKILIVGSRNKEQYVNKLESHGLEVVWHDSYEEHESVLDGKFSRADVVIICTRHTEHTSIYRINKHDEKVELIERDNANTILHRIRYALIRLGLIGNNENEESLAAVTGINTLV